MNYNLFTDNQKWWVLTLDGESIFGEDEHSNSLQTNFEFKALPTFTISLGPQYTKNILTAQWIANFTDPEAIETFSKRYVFAHLDQTIVSANIRADWIMSPKLSFQVYVQPFIASGKYADFKYLTKPRSYDFNIYGENGSTLESEKNNNGDIISYKLDPDAGDIAPSQTISNPDFNYISLRGNAVLRWEYFAGSTLYLVWTQTRENVEAIGQFRFGLQSIICLV